MRNSPKPQKSIVFKILQKNSLHVVLLQLVSLIFIHFCWATETDKIKLRFSIKNGHLAEHVTTKRFTQGKIVEIEWNSDSNTELHFHGYDILIQVSPNKPAIMKFKAHTAGRFPISIHNNDNQKHDHKNLMYFEIYPE